MDFGSLGLSVADGEELDVMFKIATTEEVAMNILATFDLITHIKDDAVRENAAEEMIMKIKEMPPLLVIGLMISMAGDLVNIAHDKDDCDICKKCCNCKTE